MNQTVHFTKMHGAGNDYIYVNTLLYSIPDPSKVAREWSDRHKGIGADGLVLIGASPLAEANFSMRMFNADGSEGEMCGNAARCVGKYLYEKGLTRETLIRLYTLAGIKVLRLDVDHGIVRSVTVDMGEPQMHNEHFFSPSGTLPDGEFVDMGCPHYVVFADDVEMAETAGGMLECHRDFPHRCNIDFVKVIDRENIRVRVWERGSGITMACGTGACATAVAAAVRGYSGRKVHIHMDGGEIHVEWSRDDNHIYMTGPAAIVYEGEIQLP